MSYYRLTFITSDGKTRTIWAEWINPPNPGGEIDRYEFLWFRRLKKDGGTPEPLELIGLKSDDILCAQKAKMNLKYAELETI